jgi:hypothetical protein
MIDRCSALSLSDRAFAPARPLRAFPEGVFNSSWISPVAIFATTMAQETVSAGLRCPSGPFGTSNTPKTLATARASARRTFYVPLHVGSQRFFGDKSPRKTFERFQRDIFVDVKSKFCMPPSPMLQPSSMWARYIHAQRSRRAHHRTTVQKSRMVPPDTFRV